MKRAAGFCTVVLSLAVVACSGANQATEAASAPAVEPAAAPAAAAAVAWADMDVEQRKEHMRNVVEPTMAKLFAAVEPEEFGPGHEDAFGCATCHGEAAKQGSFKMPNEALPKLHVANSFEKHMKEDPKMTKFMMKTVVPEMAKMLGTEPYNPQTQKGLGCFKCHVMAQ